MDAIINGPNLQNSMNMNLVGPRPLFMPNTAILANYVKRQKLGGAHFNMNDIKKDRKCYYCQDHLQGEPAIDGLDVCDRRNCQRKADYDLRSARQETCY